MLRLVSLVTMLLGGLLAAIGGLALIDLVTRRAPDIVLVASLLALIGGTICVLGGAAGFALARLRDDVAEATRRFLYPPPVAPAPAPPAPALFARHAALAESAGMSDAIRAEQARALRDTGEAISGVEALRRIQARG